MRYKKYSVFASGVCSFVLLFVSSMAWGLISGSGHDFSVYSWSNYQLCDPCHTPHNAYTFTSAVDGTNELAPLWNHTETNTIFTLYTSPTNTLDGSIFQPGKASKSCLSCHDGTIAVDSFGGKTGSIYITGSANLGTDLRDDHPIGVTWNHQSAGGNCTGCHPMVWDPDLSAFISLKPNTPMYNGRVECPSCHDVHNGFNFSGMLRVTRAGSEICYSCHGDK